MSVNHRMQLLFFVVLVGSFNIETASAITFGGTPEKIIQTRLKNHTNHLHKVVFNHETFNSISLSSSGGEVVGLSEKVFWDIKDGAWFDGEKGSKIWQLKVSSDDASMLSLLLDRLTLPLGAKMYLFNDSGQTVGAFTHFHNINTRVLPLQALYGGALTIQVEIPPNKVASFDIRIKSVGIYPKVFLKNEFSCSPSANCLSEPWRETRKSVVLLIYMRADGVYSCTGVITSNTSFDKTPYILTASHCIETAEVAATTMAYFNYEAPNCTTNSLDETPLNYPSMNAMLLRATGGDKLDFTLLEAAEGEIPRSYDYSFAGWNRGDIPNDYTVSIHHPGGFEKRYSISLSKIYSATWRGEKAYERRSHWEVQEWHTGATAAGSSGGPLFDNQQQIIGMLTGGYSSCSSPYKDYFSKFSYAWDYFSDTNAQLKYWLDPLETGVTTLKQLNVCLGDRFTWAIRYNDKYKYDASLPYVPVIENNLYTYSFSTFDETTTELSIYITDDNDKTDTITQGVSVYSPIESSVAYSVDGQNVTFTPIEDNTVLTSSWDFGDGNSISDTLGKVTHTFSELRTYRFTYIRKTYCGLDTVSEVINLNPEYILDDLASTLNSKTLSLDYSNYKYDELRLSLLDFSGRLVASHYYTDTEDTTPQVEISSLPKGVYVLNIELNRRGKVFTRSKKLIKNQ